MNLLKNILRPGDVAVICPMVADIGKPISSGGQKLVFPCFVGDQQIALKFVYYPLPDEGEELPQEYSDFVDSAAKRVVREIQTLGSCNSRNIVKLGSVPVGATVYKNMGLIYYSEEFVEGESLQRLLLRGETLSVQECVKLLLDITNAIEELWSKHAVHRDIKPDNIMWTRKERGFVLIDLGIALYHDLQRVTTPGTVYCTPFYQSPEQLKYSTTFQMDFRADLFQLGVTAYESLTGKHPFRDEGEISIETYRTNLLTQERVPPSSIVNDIPPVLDAIFLRLLAVEPHQRFRRCDILRAELEKLTTGVS
jgi:eukaryotic-like serine/threonine-protein kinase